MTGRASSSKLKRWAESIIGNDNRAYESGPGRRGESSRLFTIDDRDKYRMKKTNLSYARALRLTGGLSWGLSSTWKAPLSLQKFPKSVLRPETQEIYNLGA